ncbi:alpha/beta fold hydrolase [Streptomyces rimosus]|uniref:alpha/beta fold hydrolase n=1 Tax=Streptomyces rimosus TaxID=1927 RepID=UPI0004C1B3D3|nr:alpha/beta hydrolase [Streptomyces rimosus]
MTAAHDVEDIRIAASDGVEIAVRDHGGNGPALLLLHGAGRNLVDWELVGPLLADGHRVVAMDLRGHGKSGGGDGPWTFEGAVADVAAVLEGCGIPDAVVVGHSLGGMVAACCLEGVDGTLGAVNLDGHGMGRAEQYVGLDRGYVERRLAEARAFADAAMGRPLPGGGLEGVLAYNAAMAKELGVSRELLEAGVRRGVAEDANGEVYLRPERVAGLGMQEAMAGIDLFGLYRRVRKPLLIARALRPNPSTPGMPWVDELMAAYVKGLHAELDELARTERWVEVAGVDATHAMLLERPREVADLVADFVRRVGAGEWGAPPQRG